ncbi:phage tail tip lysozyme [Lactococcus taiwanensis]|uniref:phage tail tip lysozyme n=1 Tax=Lactococcus taiwanensis TaxID=1151742 RepID=UPI00351559B9
MKKVVLLLVALFILVSGSFGGLLFMTASLGAGEASAASESCSEMQNLEPSPLDTSSDDKANAKAIFEHLTQKNGFSGAGAAGAVAVAQRESSFNVQAVNPSGGVAGWFQWSGWGNTINGSRITAEGSIKSGDLSTLTASNEFKLLDYELNGPYNATRMTVGRADDPQQAALDWSRLYEGVALSDGQTKVSEIKANALKWYTTFDGQGIPSSITDAVNDEADDHTTETYEQANDGCEVGAGEGEQIKDHIPMGTYYKQLSPEVKKAIGKRANFTSYPDDIVNAPYGHQCVWYVSNRVKEIGWPVVGTGNGGVWGHNTPGLKVEKGQPKAHSAVNIQSGQDPYRGQCAEGHVMFVEYVNPDGSLIISECNVVAGQNGFDRATATQTEETYGTISAQEAKTLTYVYPAGKEKK